MAAWRSGITVVVAAGNSGPGPMTIGVPGNVPYVITVGAYTDNFTPYDETDDRLARFSAAGPTVEGFVKPELVAPGGHMLGIMQPNAWLPLQYPEFVQPVGDRFSMSGTSQSAAVVSGVVALMLEADPGVSPDDIKCRLLATARPALRPDGEHAYSVFQQGAGKVDAVRAVEHTGRNCANQNLDIDLDFFGQRHYVGPAGVDSTGDYYLVDGDGRRLEGNGAQWPQGAMWPEGALWTAASVWGEQASWNAGATASDTPVRNPDSLLSQGAVWPEGAMWPEGVVQTYRWVDQE
jgi:serine protease AprX